MILKLAQLKIWNKNYNELNKNCRRPLGLN